MGEHPRDHKTDIVVVGWNHTDLTYRLFESIRQNTRRDYYDLIYVDNGSLTAPVDVLLHQFADVTAVRLPTNTGFVHGANVGLALSLLDDSEYVCLLNNDVMIPDGDDTWLQRLISVLSQPEVGAVGAVSNNVFGFQRREGRNGVVTGARTVPALIFFAVLLRKRAIEGVGLLDERFSPGNYEDFDYSVRLGEKGWAMQVADGVWLEHVMHATHKDLRIDFNQLLSTNRNKFIDKWGIDTARKVGVAI